MAARSRAVQPERQDRREQPGAQPSSNAGSPPTRSPSAARSASTPTSDRLDPKVLRWVTRSRASSSSAHVASKELGFSCSVRFIETSLGTERLTSAGTNRQEITVNLADKVSPMFVSVRVRIDTEVPPGLYDDFVVTRLLNKSPNFTFVASLGFHA